MPPSDYADALSAGWVPLPPVVAVVSASAKSAGRDVADAEEFLGRVYLYQEC